MITSAECYAKFGEPIKETGMVLFNVPNEMEIGAIPTKIYCNRLLVAPLTKAFKNIIDRGCVAQLKTWDGCFNIRKKKNGTSASLHSWGLAIDINAAWNGFGKKPTMSAELVACFTDAGFAWGGGWRIADGMHFELETLP